MFDLLTPSNTTIDFDLAKDYGNLAGIIDVYSKTHRPDINKAGIFIIGIPEERNAIGNKGTSHAPDQIRKAFFKLFPGNWQVQIADLGNIKIGESVKETYQNTTEVLSNLPSDAHVILLGGSQDTGLAVSNYLDLSNKLYNISVIDAIIDSSFADADLDNENYLTHILSKNDGQLQNLNVLGIQTYYNHPSKFDIFDQLFLDYFKLGEIQHRIMEYEPELRESDFVSIDVRSIRQSDMPAQLERRPNGLNGVDICKITRMSGIAVKNKYLGIFEYNPMADKSNAGADLIAQMIWYYVEGINDYQPDFPEINRNELLKFHVENDIMTLIFYKNPKTNRWWINLPELVDEQKLFSCSEKDYKQALESQITKRIIRIIKKVTI